MKQHPKLFFSVQLDVGQVTQIGRLKIRNLGTESGASYVKAFSLSHSLNQWELSEVMEDGRTKVSRLHLETMLA